MVRQSLFIIFFILFLGACASRLKEQMKDYREAYSAGNYEKAAEVLGKSDLKKDKKSVLLWHLENGTLELARDNYDVAINHFQTSLELIDRLYTTKLTSKAASLLLNDASDDFYGASYERSYAHYFLAKAYYLRYLKNPNKLDLQGARGTILAWDTYFTHLQRSSSYKTVYQTDLMLKVFGAQIHEVSEIRNDQQIALQLYKDALQILEVQGGVFALFNKKNIEYVKDYQASLKEGKPPSDKSYEKTQNYEDLKNFLHYKILAMTKQARGFDFENQAKALKVNSEIKKRAETNTNVVVVLEEGLIPPKVGKTFNFGIKGAINAAEGDGAKKFIATVGVDLITAFAMNKLGMAPTHTTGPGSFVFAHSMTKLAVNEAAIEFELPMIDNVPLVERLELYIMNDKGVVMKRMPFPVISENGDIARVVLEEDVVARYTKTGTRVAVKHISAIITAMTLYQQMKRVSGEDGEFFAKTAAMGAYVAAAKGISALEKADVRHWTTLPRAIRMTEFSLPLGAYRVGIAQYSGVAAPEVPTKILGDLLVQKNEKALFTYRYTR